MFGTFNIMDYPGDGSDHCRNSTEACLLVLMHFWTKMVILRLSLITCRRLCGVNVIVSSTQGFDPAQNPSSDDGSFLSVRKR